jgi:hypothetical protein
MYIDDAFFPCRSDAADERAGQARVVRFAARAAARSQAEATPPTCSHTPFAPHRSSAAGIAAGTGYGRTR